MTIRCKIILIAVLLLGLLLAACVKDKNKDCRQGITVSFYSKNPCQSQAVYPAQITDVLVAVFDKNNILAKHLYRDNISLSGDYSENIEIGSGLYTVAAWSGIDSDIFDIEELQDGRTSKEDLLFRIKRTGTAARSVDNKTVWFGQGDAVYVEERSPESVYEAMSVNMQEVTNRVTITVEGLPLDDASFQISIESNNGSMNIGGGIAEDDILKYEAQSIVQNDILSSRFTLLKLETGYDYTIVITNVDDQKELFRGSLLGALILKNPYVNLNCDHDFTIDFTAEDQCDCGTYMITEIWVNNWLVHSYGTDF